MAVLVEGAQVFRDPLLERLGIGKARICSGREIASEKGPILFAGFREDVILFEAAASSRTAVSASAVSNATVAVFDCSPFAANADWARSGMEEAKAAAPARIMNFTGIILLAAVLLH